MGKQVAFTSSFKKKPFPTGSFIKEIYGKIEGNWVSSKVYHFTPEGLEPTLCAYNFRILKNEIIVTKDLKDVRFKNTTDTLNYKLNPSADYFMLDKGKHSTIRQVMIENIGNTNLVLVVDDLWATSDGLTNTLLKLRIELKKE
jgi:hypothetical protein